MRPQLYLLAILSICLGGCGSLYLPTDQQESIPPFEVEQPITLALVLGGGGTKGLAHLGVIQELERAGIRPDLIIGCSAGAIAGALYADSLEVESVAQNLIHLKRADLLDFSFLRPLFGLVNGNTLQGHMEKTLSVKKFEDLKIPLIIISTDLVSGEAIELCHGDLSSAIRASCAFPGFFKPAFLYGRYLVDGGASNPVPVSVAKKYGAKITIAVDVSEKLPSAGPKHLFGITKRSVEIAYRKFVEQLLGEADVVVKMDFENVGTFSDHLNEKIFEHGRVALLDKLPEIREKLQKNSDNPL